MSPNTHVVSRLYDALNDRDRTHIAALLSPECRLVPSRGTQEVVGAEAAADSLAAWLSNFQPGSTFTAVRELFSPENGFSHWKFTGTTLAGEDVVVNGVEYYEFTDGKISVKSSFLKS